MVWSKISPSDNKPRYLKKFGSMVLLTKDKNGAIDSIPDGWEVIQTKTGHLKLKKV